MTNCRIFKKIVNFGKISFFRYFVLGVIILHNSRRPSQIFLWFISFLHHSESFKSFVLTEYMVWKVTLYFKFFLLYLYKLLSHLIYVFTSFESHCVCTKTKQNFTCRILFNVLYSHGIRLYYFNVSRKDIDLLNLVPLYLLFQVKMKKGKEKLRKTYIIHISLFIGFTLEFLQSSGNKNYLRSYGTTPVLSRNFSWTI